MPAQLTNKYEFHPALGVALLRLRGTTENLAEALPTKNSALIIKRRVELSKIVLSLSNTDLTSHKESLTKHRLLLNINEALAIAVIKLHEASSYLSAHLVAASV